MIVPLAFLGIVYLFGAISTIFRYVIFPYIHLFCGKTEGNALVNKPSHLTILFATPYLFIVFFSYYSFYSNIGTYAVLGSDGYAYTLIPALMIWFGNEPNVINKWIYSRDSMFSLISIFLF